MKTEYTKAIENLERARKLLGETDLTTGNYHTFTESAETISIEDAIEFIKAHGGLFSDWINDRKYN